MQFAMYDLTENNFKHMAYSLMSLNLAGDS